MPLRFRAVPCSVHGAVLAGAPLRSGALRAPVRASAAGVHGRGHHAAGAHGRGAPHHAPRQPHAGRRDRGAVRTTKHAGIPGAGNHADCAARLRRFAVAPLAVRAVGRRAALDRIARSDGEHAYAVAKSRLPLLLGVRILASAASTDGSPPGAEGAEATIGHSKTCVTTESRLVFTEVSGNGLVWSLLPAFVTL